MPSRKHPINWKNGANKQEAHSCLEEAFQLVENERFFSNLSDTTMPFYRSGYFHYEILPVNFNPYVYTGEQFYLRPTLPVLTGQSRFFRFCPKPE